MACGHFHVYECHCACTFICAYTSFCMCLWVVAKRLQMASSGFQEVSRPSKGFQRIPMASTRPSKTCKIVQDIPGVSTSVYGLLGASNGFEGLPRASKTFQELPRHSNNFRFSGGSKAFEGLPRPSKGCQQLPRALKGCHRLPRPRSAVLPRLRHFLVVAVLRLVALQSASSLELRAHAMDSHNAA